MKAIFLLSFQIAYVTNEITTDDKLITHTTGLKPKVQVFAQDKAITDWTKEASVTGQFY